MANGRQVLARQNLSGVMLLPAAAGWHKPFSAAHDSYPVVRDAPSTASVWLLVLYLGVGRESAGPPSFRVINVGRISHQPGSSQVSEKAVG